MNKRNSNLSCCVYGCDMNTRKDAWKYSFHGFPKENSGYVYTTNQMGILERMDRNKAWAMRVGKSVVNSHMKVCCLHFVKDDYVSPNICLRLRKTAVPSQNLPQESFIERIPKPRELQIFEKEFSVSRMVEEGGSLSLPVQPTANEKVKNKASSSDDVKTLEATKNAVYVRETYTQDVFLSTDVESNTSISTDNEFEIKQKIHNDEALKNEMASNTELIDINPVVMQGIKIEERNVGNIDVKFQCVGKCCSKKLMAGCVESEMYVKAHAVRKPFDCELYDYHKSRSNVGLRGIHTGKKHRGMAKVNTPLSDKCSNVENKDIKSVKHCCDICNFLCTDTNDLIDHLSETHDQYCGSIKDQKYVDVGKTSQDSNKNVNIRTLSDYLISDEETIEVSQRTYAGSIKVKQVERVKGGYYVEIKHVCSRCKESFHSKYALKKHVAAHGVAES